MTTNNLHTYVGDQNDGINLQSPNHLRCTCTFEIMRRLEFIPFVQFYLCAMALPPHATSSCSFSAICHIYILVLIIFLPVYYDITSRTAHFYWADLVAIVTCGAPMKPTSHIRILQCMPASSSSQELMGAVGDYIWREAWTHQILIRGNNDKVCNPIMTEKYKEKHTLLPRFTVKIALDNPITILFYVSKKGSSSSLAPNRFLASMSRFLIRNTKGGFCLWYYWEWVKKVFWTMTPIIVTDEKKEEILTRKEKIIIHEANMGNEIRLFL